MSALFSEVMTKSPRTILKELGIFKFANRSFSVWCGVINLSFYCASEIMRPFLTRFCNTPNRHGNENCEKWKMKNEKWRMKNEKLKIKKASHFYFFSKFCWPDPGRSVGLEFEKNLRFQKKGSQFRFFSQYVDTGPAFCTRILGEQEQNFRLPRESKFWFTKSLEILIYLFQPARSRKFGSKS